MRVEVCPICGDGPNIAGRKYCYGPPGAPHEKARWTWVEMVRAAQGLPRAVETHIYAVSVCERCDVTRERVLEASISARPAFCTGTFENPHGRREMRTTLYALVVGNTLETTATDAAVSSPAERFDD